MEQVYWYHFSDSIDPWNVQIVKAALFVGKSQIYLEIADLWKLLFKLNYKNKAFMSL